MYVSQYLKIPTVVPFCVAAPTNSQNIICILFFCQADVQSSALLCHFIY